MNINKIKYLALGAFVVLFFACSGNTTDSHEHGSDCSHSQDNATEVTTEQEAFQVEDDEVIVLNETETHHEGCNHSH